MSPAGDEDADVASGDGRVVVVTVGDEVDGDEAEDEQASPSRTSRLDRRRTVLSLSRAVVVGCMTSSVEIGRPGGLPADSLCEPHCPWV